MCVCLHGLGTVALQVVDPATGSSLAIGAGAGDIQPAQTAPPRGGRRGLEGHQDVVGLLGADGVHPIHREAGIVHLEGETGSRLYYTGGSHLQRQV